MGSNFNVENTTAEEAIFLCVKIKEENERNVPLKRGEAIESVCKVIRNPEGHIIAGIVGYMYDNFKYVYIRSLWVSKAVRRNGYGTTLLESLENEAVNNGIKFAHLNAFEFSDRGFLEKNGYEVFCVLEEFALNNKRYSMKKALKNNVNSKVFYIIQNGTNDDAKYINDRMLEYNSSIVPFTNEEVFDYIDKVIKDDDGAIIGGIMATISPWTDLKVEGIWVKDEYENKGFEDKLLKSVEDELKSNGGHLAFIETFDANAKDFYISQGYTLCGTLDEYPRGYKSYYMKQVF